MEYPYRGFSVFDATLMFHNESTYMAEEVLKILNLVDEIFDELERIESILLPDYDSNSRTLLEYHSEIRGYWFEVYDYFQESCMLLYDCPELDRAEILRQLWLEMEEKLNLEE